MTEARRIAFQLIYEWETKQTFPNLALKSALRSVRDERDRRFITALVYGVVERKITLDHYLAQCSDRKAEGLSPAVRSALRMGIYQLFYMHIPASAACNTTVALLKQQGHAYSAGYVNAVLRRCDRERETLLQLKKADFSVRYSMDPALVDLLLAQYGKGTFVRIMDHLSQPSTDLYLFHNIKKCSVQQFLNRLEEEGVSLEPTDLPQLYRAKRGFPIEQSGAYRAGFYHIVGYHSALAALQVPKEAKRILDLCAAPGGKTFVMAAVTDAEVIAFDLHPHKVEALKNNAARLGHLHVTARTGDSTRRIPSLENAAEFVLADVPCSGLGMLGKKPDIKYKYPDSERLTAIQKNILSNGASYLREGGILVYSTCTIDQRENEQIIQWFLDTHPEFTPEQTPSVPGQKTFLPLDGQDGFFIAVLKKGSIR